MINAVGTTRVWHQTKLLDPFKITLKARWVDVRANLPAKPRS